MAASSDSAGHCMVTDRDKHVEPYLETPGPPSSLECMRFSPSGGPHYLGFLTKEQKVVSWKKGTPAAVCWDADAQRWPCLCRQGKLKDLACHSQHHCQ